MYSTKAISKLMCETLTDYYHSWLMSVSSAVARGDIASARTYTYKFIGQLNIVATIENELYDMDSDFGFDLYDLQSFYYKLSKRVVFSFMYV